jgi:serine/threonine protein kinase
MVTRGAARASAPSREASNLPAVEGNGCIPVGELAAFASHELSLSGLRRVEEHLSGCAACRAALHAVLPTEVSPTGSLDEERSPAAGERVLPPGTIIGRFVLRDIIGAGGMGVVYAAHDPELKRAVAIKVLRQRGGADASGILEARMRREAQAMARLSHPNVLPIFDVTAYDGRLVVAMELVEGGTLRDWLAREKRTPAQIIDVLAKAGRGLAAAHAAGLVHRDFKPDNVLVGDDGQVRVTDFGLACFAGAPSEPDAGGEAAAPKIERAISLSITRPGTILGTPAYMSPEQLRGEPADARTDQFSFCVALCEALYGGRPFDGSTLAELREATSAGRISLPRGHRGVPRGLRRILFVGLRPRPEDRQASMAALLEAIDRATRSHSVGRLSVAGSLLAAAGAIVIIALVWDVRGADSSGVSAPVATAPLSNVSAAARTSSAGPDSIQVAVAALAGPDARLACPIFDTHGVSDVGVRLGAGAAMLACARESWELGGMDDRVLPPAALLDVPTQPADGFPDPYIDPDQRARTIAIAKVRAAAYIDGRVTFARSSWDVELVVRAPDEREIARTRADGPAFLDAMRRATEALWAPPLVRRTIDPEVASWTAFSDVDVGVMQADMTLFASTSKCDALERSGGKFARSLPYFQKLCELFGAASPPLEASAPVVDESSPQALVTSLRLLAVSKLSLPVDEGRRLATKLEGLRSDEESSFGRSRLASAAGHLWSDANEGERARAPLLLALRDDPLHYDAWELVVRLDGALLAQSGAASVASAWFPAEAAFIGKASSWRGDELDSRLRDARLAFVLEPSITQAMHLGRALAEAGRADDARAVAVTPLRSADESRNLSSYVQSFIDLHDAKLRRAILHLEDAGNLGMVDLVVVAEVAGRSDEVAARWAERFLSRADDEAGATARGYHAPMVLCMRAGGDLARRCLDRIATLGRAARNWWYEGGTALLEGARRYAAEDIRGAVSAWRPLVVGSNLEIVRALPTEAFERAGEPDLAARLDARKMVFTFIGGVGDAAPREASRAFARGDRKRAGELARSVVQAWEVADVDVPAVGQMRTLLKAIDD